MARMKSKTAAVQSSATIGFKAKPWLAVDKLRNNKDSVEYKYVVASELTLTV